MQQIQLKKMTRELCHELYKHWSNDPSIYADMSVFKPYTYTKLRLTDISNRKMSRPVLYLQLCLTEARSESCS